MKVSLNWQHELEKAENIFGETALHFFKKIPLKWRETAALNVFAWAKLPLIGFLGPVVEEYTDDRVTVKIPLTWRAKNHLGSMYFGALTTGADLAGGVVAFKEIGRFREKRIDFVFKDMKAEFKKRAEDDVFFVTYDVLKVREMVQEASESDERKSVKIHIDAMVPNKLGQEPAASFELTMSVKRR